MQLINDVLDHLSREWGSWLGVVGTVLGLWISWKLREHPALHYTVISPATAVPGEIRWAAAGPATEMTFTATLTNSGTSAINGPSRAGGTLALACPEDSEFARARATRHTGDNPQVSLTIANNPRYMVVDFSVLEPGQAVEIEYGVRSKNRTSRWVGVPAAVGRLTGSLEGISNRRSAGALVWAFLKLLATQLADLATSVFALWLADALIMGTLHPDSLAVRFVLVLLAALLIRVVAGVLGGMMWLAVADQDDPVPVTVAGSSFARFAILLGVMVVVTFWKGMEVAAGVAAIGLPLALFFAVCSALFPLVLYKPTADVSTDNLLRLLLGGVTLGVIQVALLLAVHVGVMPVAAAFGVFVLWLLFSQLTPLIAGRRSARWQDIPADTTPTL